MSTKDLKVDIYLKKFLSQQQMVENFQNLVQKYTEDLYSRLFGLSGVYFGGVLSSSAVDTFDISTPLIGTNSQGKDIELDPVDALQIPFENLVATNYYVGLRFLEIPEDVETNVRTGKIKYIYNLEAIGEKADPDSVVDDADGTMTIIVDSVTESGVSNAGRKVKVWLKRTEDGGALGPQTLISSIEELTVQWDGSNNYVETVTGLGQLATAISVDANDYEVALLGPTVKKNTDLSLIPEMIFIGIVEGAGAGNSPTVFDQTGLRVLNTLTPLPGTGLLVDTRTLLEEGGVVGHDPSTIGLMTWSADLQIRPFGSTEVCDIAAGNITLADDEVAYVSLPNPFLSNTLVMQKASRGSTVLTNANTFWIFHRNGSFVNARGGLQFEQGEQRQLDDIVIGNSIFFSDDDRIRFDEATNVYHLDADGSNDSADLALGTTLYAGALANGDYLKFTDGVTPTWSFFLDSLAKLIITEAGDVSAARDLLTEAKTAYEKISDNSAITGVNASLNELWDQTLSRELLRPTPSNPADTIVNIAAALVTLASTERFGLINNQTLSAFAGGSVDFGTGTVVGGANFTPYTPSGVSRFFKYAIVLNSSDQLEVVLPSADAASAAAAAEPQILSGIPIAIITVEDDGAGGSGTINNIDESQILRFGAAGSGSGGASTASDDSGGGELLSLNFLAEVIDAFSDTPDGTTITDVGANKTDAGLHSGANKYFRLAYDAAKTLTGTGTSMVLSAAPGFTVKVGDILVYDGEAKAITVLGSINSDGGSGTPFTIESAFTIDPVAAQATVSQAWYSVDLNNYSEEGVAVSSLITDNINQALITYEDSEALDDIVPDFNSAPLIAYSASADGSTYSGVLTRETNIVDQEQIALLSSAGTNLYVRMFANKTSGAGFVNLLRVEVRWHVEPGTVPGTILDQFYGLTDESAAPLNGTVDNTGLKTVINLGFKYAFGSNPGEAEGDLWVELDGKRIYRIATPGQAYYTEIDDQTIELDQDYEPFPYTIAVKRMVGTFDNTDSNVGRIQLLEDYTKNAFEDELITPDLMEATSATGSPTAGTFHSVIKNRKSMFDLRNDILPRFGVERISIDNIYRIAGEYGPAEQEVYGVYNDKFDSIRLFGFWDADVNSKSRIIRSNTIFPATKGIEITFYGTGLNILASLTTIALLANIYVDGVVTTPVNIYTPTTSAILESRNYRPNQVMSIVSGLPLGLHTVLITGDAANASSLHFNGLEVINENLQIRTNPGMGWIDRLLAELAAEDAQDYNTGFESGVLGTKGGRALMYLKSDGTIAKVVNPVDVSQLNLGATDHSNEEIVEVLNWREFGAGRTDDFSTLETSPGIRAFTLEDGTTTLVGNNVREALGGFFITTASVDFFTITFIGTGLDLTAVIHNGTPGNTPNEEITIDGVLISSTQQWALSARDTRLKIVSGLPYGTHTVKIRVLPGGAGVTGDLTVKDFIIYGPKKPALPTDAIEVADYNVLANFDSSGAVGTSAANNLEVPKGTIFKQALREMIYIGSWALTSNLDAPGYTYPRESAGTDELSFYFFGNGISLNLLASAAIQSFNVQIDGVNAPGATGLVNVSDAGAGNYDAVSGLNKPIRADFTGLSFGVHRIRIDKVSGDLLRLAGFYIHSGIHTPKRTLTSFNGQWMVGSQGMNDLRKFNTLKDEEIQKAIATTKELASFVTTSTVEVSLPNAITQVKVTKKTRLRLLFESAFANGTAITTFQANLYMNGVKVDNEFATTATSASSRYTGQMERIVEVGPGTYFFNVKVRTNAGTLTVLETYLTVEQID